ncbi:membrane integrity-associated transporter subunit PqiC [Vibrio sp. 404]|uniref:Membrane integrity-associated transporter subunit PqiC n=1 Tax=Vibrio marinisediminis TaxID=2758441 RepID=A0A7W2FMC7_9VIBR|nr:ABC-type transport auxiliary lipoprotein family protein [Vibrio marinisediminis]MBA5760756.1 membrane integrity-associated transporter subunit PqiC [Vibrio marinisediminis]
MRKMLMLGLLTLAGCAAQTPNGVQQYLLPDSGQHPMANQSDPLLLVEVNLASYLDVNGIVYQTSATEIVQAKQHLWASDVQLQLQDQVIERLRSSQDGYWAVGLSSALNVSDSSKLIMQIDKFNGSYSGSAQVGGEWMLVDSDGNITKGGMFKQQVALESEGYHALVMSLSEGLDDVIEQISQEL